MKTNVFSRWAGVFVLGSIGAMPAWGVDAAPAFNPEQHAVISTDRPDGRYVATRGIVQEMLRKKPLLSFDPSFTPQKFAAWKETVKAMLRKEVLAFPDLPPAPPAKRLSAEKRDGYTLEKWEHYPMPGAVVPFLMLVPDGVTEKTPAPAVLCLPGTNRTKESLAGEPERHPFFAVPRFEKENGMALQYAKAGIVAVAVDNPGFGELSDLEVASGQRYLSHNEVQTFGHHLFNLGWSYMGYAAYVADRLLVCMRHDARIDRRRLATSGHSLGAWLAGYLAVLNDDLAAAVMNQGIYSWREAAKTMTRPAKNGRRPQTLGALFFIPGLYRFFDHPDIQAALAPRPALYSEGLPERDLQTIYRPAYAISGAPENLTVVQFEKYRNPSSRHNGDVPEGIGSLDELWRYYSNDAPQHYFKGEAAVPWLKNVLGVR